jgi:hypothetical protein
MSQFPNIRDAWTSIDLREVHWQRLGMSRQFQRTRRFATRNAIHFEMSPQRLRGSRT